jgi:hypothetical protein
MEGNIHSEEHAGIVPRSVKAILEQLEASDSEYTIRVSFLELCKYNLFLSDGWLFSFTVPLYWSYSIKSRLIQITRSFKTY